MSNATLTRPGPSNAGTGSGSADESESRPPIRSAGSARFRFGWSLRRRRGRRHPVRALIDFGLAKPRVAVIVTCSIAAVFMVGLLLLISSIQAFMILMDGTSATDIATGGNSAPATSGATGQATASPSGATATPTGSGQHPTAPVSRAEVVAIEGIYVHTSIAENLQALLAAARADGVNLSGWGWRDHQTQIRLRREHCGTSEYAIYNMPSSQCSPPTARPGRSQHELGLAIDFTYSGRSIGTRSSPGFRWLQANAGAFGFRNLASEPWHWSTTGR